MRRQLVVLGLGLVLATIAVVLGLSMSQRSEIIAQPPSVDDRLDGVEDDLARLQSDVQGVRADLTRALDELSNLRGDVAVLSDRVLRLSRASRATPSEPATYTQSLVEEAIARYERDGRDAAIAHYNDPESADGPWYVFIFDEDGAMIAHENPELVGSSAAEITGPAGYPAGRMILGVASVEGAWVSYQFNNPALGRTQIKHSWIVRHDGLIFGSGWYENVPSRVHAPGAFTQSYVQQAIEMYRVLGRDATLEFYNSPTSADGEWYMFIHRADGTRLAHAHRAGVEGWLGSNVRDSVDVSGYHYGGEMTDIDPTSGCPTCLRIPPPNTSTSASAAGSSPMMDCSSALAGTTITTTWLERIRRAMPESWCSRQSTRSTHRAETPRWPTTTQQTMLTVSGTYSFSNIKMTGCIPLPIQFDRTLSERQESVSTRAGSTTAMPLLLSLRKVEASG